ncbi:MAG: hypothetical protein NW204_01185 [Xanthomonadaceae bacterium]|nr:hypothetical protein [Xanthomonadaceae bacterium]
MRHENTHWGLALDGGDPRDAVDWFAARFWSGVSPEQLVVGYQPQRPKADWKQRICASGKGVVAAYFTADRSQSLIAYPSGVVAGRFPFAPDLDAALHCLETAPFAVASFDTLHEQWSSLDRKYRPPSFSRNHFPHGWGCAFKAEGHDRLVSRRWLDAAPWQVTHGAGDLSLVQFHALAAPAKIALAQAKPGHRAMGINDEGGFLQQPYVFSVPLAGLYAADEQMLRVVVLGREPPAVELRDARAAVKQGALAADKPLKRVAYVFPDPAQAQRHLPALWLRELECWTVIDGIEQRLDLTYSHQRPVPEWAA